MRVMPVSSELPLINLPAQMADRLHVLGARLNRAQQANHFSSELGRFSAKKRWDKMDLHGFFAG